MKIVVLGHTSRGRPSAVDTGVVARELNFDRGGIEKIFMNYLGELGVLLTGWAAVDREHALDGRIEETLAQHSLSDHPSGSEKDGLHGFISTSVEWITRGQERNSSRDAATCSLAGGSVCAKKTGASV